MKKKLLGTLLCTAMAASLAGCGGGSSEPAATQATTQAAAGTEAAATEAAPAADSAAGSPEFVFTYAENQPEDYPTTLGAYKFAELVKEKTNGRIEIKVQAGGVLGDEKTVIEQLQFGGIDFTRVSLSPLAEFVPKLNVLQLPYLYKDAEHMWSVLDGEIGDDFMNSFDGSNMVALSWYDAGARNFYNSQKPVATLDDMKGLKIRVQESELMMGMVEALGANPTPMAYAEVYSGLQTGVIDGAENNWPSYESTSHFEVAKYYTIDEHTRVPELQLVAQSTWDKLSAEDQAIIKECALESAKHEKELWAEREKVSEEKVRSGGAEITELSADEKAKFQEAVKPMYEKFCGDYMDVVDAIIAAGK